MWFRIFFTIFYLNFLAYFCSAQQIELFIANDTLFEQPDKTIEIPIRVKDFKEVIGFEFTLKFDSTALKFVSMDSSVVPTVVPNKNTNGRIRFLWANAVGLSLSDSAALLKLYFRTAQNEPLISKVRFESLDFYVIRQNNIVSNPASGLEQVVVIRTCRTAVSLGRDLNICPGQNARIEVNCINCMSFRWSDGRSDKVRVIDTTGILSIEARGTFRCKATDSIQIGFSPVPVLKMPIEQILCPEKDITLSSEHQGASKFLWSTSATTPSITISQPGTYRLTITNTEGCTAEDSTLVTQSGPVDAILSVEQPNCQRPQGSVSISNIQGGTLPYIYAANGGVWGQSNRFNLEAGRAHQIGIQDANGCEWFDSAVLQPVYLPSLTLSPQKSVLILGDSVLLSASIPATYPDSLIERLEWTPLEGLTLNNAHPTQVWANPSRSTTYTVTLWSKDGCTASDSAQIFIKQTGDWRFFAPNAIAPESGRGNGAFSLELQDTRIEKVARLAVYDRWGSVVFESSNPNPVWNGQMPQGAAAPTGVFIWVGELALKEGGKAIVTGEITVVR